MHFRLPPDHTFTRVLKTGMFSDAFGNDLNSFKADIFLTGCVLLSLIGTNYRFVFLLNDTHYEFLLIKSHRWIDKPLSIEDILSKKDLPKVIRENLIFNLDLFR